MTTSTLLTEWDKCQASPYYFATTYCKLYDKESDEHPYTTLLSEEEFNNYVWTIIGNMKTIS
jgi:hypothetical protein